MVFTLPMFEERLFLRQCADAQAAWLIPLTLLSSLFIWTGLQPLYEPQFWKMSPPTRVHHQDRTQPPKYHVLICVCQVCGLHP